MQLAHDPDDDAPLDAEYVPAMQFWHTVVATAAMADDHVPAMQLAHDPDDDAPLDAEYVPAMQLAHFPDDVAPILTE